MVRPAGLEAARAFGATDLTQLFGAMSGGCDIHQRNVDCGPGLSTGRKQAAGLKAVPHLPDARPQVFSYSTWSLFAKLSGRAVIEARPPLLWRACLKLAVPNGAAFFFSRRWGSAESRICADAR